MKSLSALEISYLIKELDFLINARIDKIYVPRKKEIIIQLYASSKGKYSIKIDEKSFYLTEYKPASETPSDFCMYLRKKLGTARLRKIHQLGFERIVSFEFETKSAKFELIAELFSTGNIILTKNSKIIVAAEYQNWKDRTIRPNESYNHPKKDYNFLELKITELKKLLSETKKENIVKCLAIDLGLGGVYSEEACLTAEIDKNKKANELEENEIKKLFSSLEELKSKKISPRSVYKNNEIIDLVPFELKFYSDLKQEHAKTYSEILDSYFSKGVSIKQKEKHQKQIESIQKIIDEQKQDIERLEKEEHENKEKAELLYKNYQLVSNILSELKEISKKHSWKDIKDKLKDHKLIKEVTPAEKSIVIELK